MSDKRIPAEFVRHFVHEFATPLTVLVLTLEHIRGQLTAPEAETPPLDTRPGSSTLDGSVLDGSVLDERTLEDLRETLRSAENATGFLGALLGGLSALAVDGVSAREVDSISANAVVESVVSMLAPLVSHRGIRLEADLLVEDRLLVADHVGVQQILINLVGNASKFSPLGGLIRITLTSSDDVVSLAIGDQGPGIDPTDFAFLLEDGSRLERDRNVPGTGVGLHVSAQLINGYGGSLRLVPSQTGTLLVVELPATQRVAGPSEG